MHVMNFFSRPQKCMKAFIIIFKFDYIAVIFDFFMIKDVNYLGPSQLLRDV